MLSIIVTSDRDDFFNTLESNIKDTTNSEYEIIRIKNLENGLSSAYNNGAKISKFSILCFVHDDVLFHTKGWDIKVIKHVNNNVTGIIGVMGGRYKSAFGLGWRDGKTSFYRYSIKDGVNNGKHLYSQPNDEVKSEVICLDGAFLCCRKEVWKEFRFDEKMFKGFHFYDIDFTFRVAQKYSNFMVNNILLEHFSQGTINRKYLLDSQKFDAKHHKELPCTLEDLSSKETSQLEGYALAEKLSLLKKHGFPFSLRMALLGKYLRIYFNPYHIIRNLYFGFIK